MRLDATIDEELELWQTASIGRDQRELINIDVSTLLGISQQ